MRPDRLAHALFCGRDSPIRMQHSRIFQTFPLSPFLFSMMMTVTTVRRFCSEPAAVGPAQLGVCALFGSSCSEQGRSDGTAPSLAWEAGSSKGGRQAAPPHSGRPLAMTSMRRAFWRAGSTFKTLTSTLRATCPSFFAHTSSSEGLPWPQNAGARAGGRVVAARIEVCTATASGRG